MLQKWNVSREDALAAADANMAELIAGKRPEVQEIDGMKLAMVPVSSVFKASVIFAPNFKDFVSDVVGWPVLVVIPCRDFIFVIPEKDKALLNRMGRVVQDEFRNSGYPVTTEVLRISDNEIEAIGKFPE